LNKTRLWRQRYERDFWRANPEIHDWLRRYELDFPSTVPREIDEEYEQYRLDVMPKRHGGFTADVRSFDVAKCTNPLFRDLVLVGRGQITNANCGVFRGHYGCLQYQKHEGDIVFALKYFNSCDKPTCPSCYRLGWAVKESRAIGARLSAASGMFGLPVDHVMVSLPKSDHDLPFKEAKRRCIEVLSSRGIEGGILIPHSQRINRETGAESYSPHFHSLCFLSAGYSCRNCERKWNCREGCGGFDDRNHQLSLKDGYVVKVLDARKTVAGTAWYQLHHSSTNPYRKRFRVATYFGSCGYNNLRAKVEKPKLLCPLCGSQCGFIEYTGSKRFVTDKNSPDFVSKSFEDYFEHGVPAWQVKEFDGHD
jgi:hypothetical protein